MTPSSYFFATTLTPEGLAKAGQISVQFTKLLVELEDILPGNSRELSIVRTKLEEASFYAKKALVNYKENVAQ